MKARLILLTVLLTGCTTQYAVYRHPVTGDVLECERPAGGASIQGHLVHDACKSELEARGYQRTGTVERAPSATSLSEAAKPRPAPR